ncbi:GNAT family N-acetyltransferase [Haloarchaeobius sp. TZWWS8]|uniref:GNAT family N-acetyltransferase n=1 Tax=Haloarchaeobius sp. TZWWS8 TaxID=3446121 RepID=UPI003EBE0704
MQILRDVDEDVWWDVARECPHATFFHTPLWADIATASTHAETDRTVGAELSNGTTVVLPLVQPSPSGDRALRRLHSTFVGCYGGLIADGPVTDEVADLFRELVTWQTGELSLVENPLADDPVGLDVLHSDEVLLERDFTQILELDAPYEVLYDNFSKDRRYGCRKADDAGVVVREATKKQEFWAYYGAYRESIQRWDDVSIEYDWSLFERIYDLTQEYPENVKLWVTDIDGDIGSGALMFYWNDHVVNWHAASYADYFEYYINDVIHSTIIEDAVDRGFQYYDFNPSGGNEGVVKFKSEFGPEKWPLRRWSYESRPFRAAKGVFESFQSHRDDLF